MPKTPKLLDVVALLADVPGHNLSRGQVGTVVEILERGKLLLEFSDDSGKAYAVAPVSASDVLVLHYEKEVA
jgi:hypothetical protein